MVSMATGSVIWGAVAASYSLTLAMLLAALTCVLAAGGYLWRMRVTEVKR
jgi:hypothetical protein